MITAQTVTWVAILRHDIVPVLSGYLVFVAMLGAYWRSMKAGKAESRSRSEEPSRTSTLKMSLNLRERRTGVDGYAARPFYRYLVGTFLGGFAFFLMIVTVFYFVIGEKSRTFISQALGQGSLLTFAVVLPAFLLLSFLEDRVRRARKRRRPNKDMG